MQMLPFDFWHHYSFADFQRKSFYFFRNKNDEFKNGWEQIRKLGYINALVNGAKVTPQEVIPLPWDKDAVVKKEKPMTAKEADEVLKRYERMGLINKN